MRKHQQGKLGETCESATGSWISPVMRMWSESRVNNTQVVKDEVTDEVCRLLARVWVEKSMSCESPSLFSTKRN